MNSLQLAVTVASGLALLFTGLGASFLYLRRGLATERDVVRRSSVEAWKDVVEAQEARHDAQYGELTDWAARLERHHTHAHGRCTTGPRRDN